MMAKFTQIHRCGVFLKQCFLPIANIVQPSLHQLTRNKGCQSSFIIQAKYYSSQSCQKPQEFDPATLTITECVRKNKPCKWSDHIKDLMGKITKEEQQKIDLFKMEYDMMEATGCRVPETLTDEMLVFLLFKSPTASSRRKDMEYWFKLERAVQKSQIKKAEKKRLHENKSCEESGNFDSRIMFRIRKDTMRKHCWNNLCHAMIHGPHLLFDCDFEHELTEREAFNMAKQFRFCIDYNLICKEPFHFHFCNLRRESIVRSRMQHIDPTFCDSPISVSDDCFLNHYPKKDLVYLTPDAKVTLDKVDASKTYIIGGIVDLGNTAPLTLAKAKKHSIKMAKLPLDDYVKWIKGSKSLTIDQVVRILHEQLETGDWMHTFHKHLPRRKFAEYNADSLRQTSMRRGKKKYY